MCSHSLNQEVSDKSFDFVTGPNGGPEICHKSHDYILESIENRHFIPDAYESCDFALKFKQVEFSLMLKAYWQSLSSSTNNFSHSELWWE